MSFDGSRLRDDPVLQAVLGVTVLGLLARVVTLGTRVAHFDEGRVAYWTLHYLQSGEFHYRYIIHGPFVQHVDKLVFGAIGPSDFAARLPVAIVGALLPLVALLLRERLSRVETVGVAIFLAVDPILLYYSRFMRSTLLVATFCFLAFACFVRWYDGHGVGYGYAGVAALAFGFASKENAVLYVLCWLGAGALLLDHVLFQPGTNESGIDRAQAWRDRLVERLRAGERTVERTAGVWAGHVVAATLLFFLLILFFYAPRGGGGPDLWQAVFNPGMLPDLVRVTAKDIGVGYGYWFSNPAQGESVKGLIDTYTTRLGRFVGTSIAYAGPLFALAIAGFLVERYVADRPRLFVMFASYWGFVSVLGYPLGTDVWGAWIIVNALVPLAIPAAVGLGLIVEAGIDALQADDQVGVGAVAVILFVVVGQVGFAAATGVYANPTSPDNKLVQYAQPQQDMRQSMDEMQAIARANEGPDVLVYGSEFADFTESAPRKPACIKWFDTLPLAWYIQAHDASTVCHDAGSLPADYDFPPMVVVKGNCTLSRTIDCRTRPGRISAPKTLTEELPDRYERNAFFLRTTGKPVVVFTDPKAT